MAAKAKKSGRLAIYTRQDKAILFIGYVLLALFVVAIVVPVAYIVVASFMDPVTLQNRGITFDFSKWTLTAYERVATDAQICAQIWIGFKNAVLYSVLFTVISVVVTMLAAYPMSLPDFRGKKIFNTLFVITMFFGGGLIPTYLLINNLGLLDSMWAVILPGAFSVWNMIIARTYYQGVPRELRVQLVLRSILIQSQPESGMIADIQSTAERAQLAELLKYATIIISSLPLIVMYPFFQKYFDAGIMAGSIKG